jgi:hypothetical protein
MHDRFWGAWHDSRLLLSAGGGFWMMRNVSAAPAVTVHPGEAEGTVVVVEGTVRAVADIEWRDAAVAAYNAKYRWVYRGDSPGTVEVVVDRVYAWRAKGPKTGSATRYRFER